ncbi:MAG: sigma-70 family RNA polymerase sigma factor [Sedimentisphaerales bacterium]|nr:sigma-70 family RNA polymerase sigma factor [Sedimentisphaerales bacterium]
MTTETENTPEMMDGTATEPVEGCEHLKAVALRTYSGHKHPPIGDEQILQLLPMVHRIARRAVTYLRPPLSFDDLVSAGTVGLLKAARDFDASHLAEFTTYAYIRVKGAILDELRRASLLPSGINKRIGQALRLSREITQRTGSPPSDEELAERLGIPIEEVYALFEGARAQHFASLDGSSTEEPALGNLLAAADDAAAPGSRLEKAEMLEKLAEAMQQLDQRRLQIIVLYYHKHLTMKQIAGLLEITESRVSQLHASALVSLSAKLEDYNDGR